MTLARMVPAFLLVASLALAGCGDDEDEGAAKPVATATATALTAEQYTAALAAIGEDADQAHEGLDAAFSAPDVETVKSALTRFSEAEDALGDSVDELSPPEDATEANLRLAAGLHEFAGEISATVDGITAETPKAALKYVEQQLGDASGAEKVDGALTDLKKLGYSEEG